MIVRLSPTPVFRVLVSAWGGLLLWLMTPPVSAFRDDFDDGNDEGWTRFDPLGELGVAEPVDFLLEEGGYRFRAPVPAADAAGPARAFSYVAGEEYEDFYCSVDVLDWNDDINQAFGILGRAQNVALGQTTGYVCNYNPNQTGGEPGGQFQINRVTGEAEDGTIAAADIKLIADHDYRIVFIGEGDRLMGLLFDLENLAEPLVTLSTDGRQDERAVTYPSGACGLFNFYRGGDALEPHAIPDTRFDNFLAEARSPHPELFPGVAPFDETALRLRRLDPGALVSFHPPHRGIRFEVTRADDIALDPDQVRIFLGEDREADPAMVSMVEHAGTLEVQVSGLRPNAIYHSRVELRSSEGELAQYRWQFDTFDAAQLDSDAWRVIEAEDYNFNGGDFVEAPSPSGLSANGLPVETGEEGYFEKVGMLGVDFFDTDETPQDSNDYRPDDPVGLRAGSDQVEPGPRLHDVPRQKYRSTGAVDYQLYRTEAGEWTNYTRTFPKGRYAVYLRAASRWAQSVRLDRVTSDPSVPNQSTEPLGNFAVPNTVTPQLFRHVPLAGEDGEPLTVELEGETTLRMTMAGPDRDFALRRVLYLNYLLFVPRSEDEPNLEVSRGGVFGELLGGAATSVTLPIFNSAKAETLTIAQARIQGENAELYRVDALTANIGPGELGSVTVTFSPGNREGVFLADLIMESNDASDPEIVVDLTARVPLSNQLLVHYPLDETEGSVVVDVSGNRRDGVYRTTGNGSVVLGRPGLATGTAVSLSDDGEGAGFIEIPTEAGLPPLDAFTASVWLKLASDEPQGTLLSKGTQPADPFAVAVAGAQLAWGADSEQVFQTEDVVTAGTAQHLVLTYAANGEAGEVSIYVDGQRIVANGSGGVFDDGSPSPLHLGALNGVIGLRGELDDFQLYARVLSEEEIAFLHDHPGTPVGGGDAMHSSTVAFTGLASDGTHLDLTFTSEPGVRYELEANPGLHAGGWTVLMHPVGAELPADQTVVRVPLEGFAARFFRLREAGVGE